MRRRSSADGDKGRVYSYEVVATVEDIDRQAISKRDSRLVFSSEQLLGAKLTTDAKSEDSLYFVTKGQALHPEGGLRGPGRKAATPPGRCKGRLVREDWKLVRELTVGGMVDTRYEKEEVEEKTFTVKPGQPFGSAQLATQKSGSYAIELSGKDAKGRESFTAPHLLFHRRGRDHLAALRRDGSWRSSRTRRSTRPGDTARLLIKSPVAKGTYLVSVERDGVLEKRALDLTGSAPTIDVRRSPRSTFPWCTCSVAVSYRTDRAARRRARRAGLRQAARVLGARRDPRRDRLPHHHADRSPTRRTATCPAATQR